MSPQKTQTLIVAIIVLFCCFLCAAPGVQAAEPAVTAAKEENPAMLSHTKELIAGKKPIRVVIYGDSISEVKPGWNGGAKTPEANWGAVLVKKLQAAYPDSAWSVHHFAIGGQNTYEGLGRLDWLEPFKPDLVLVAFGANDCCHHFLIPEETQLALTTLATEIPKRFGARLLYPQRYIPNSFGIYVSELGWHKGEEKDGVVSMPNDRPLSRRMNRVMISAREKATNRTAVRFWMVFSE